MWFAASPHCPESVPGMSIADTLAGGRALSSFVFPNLAEICCCETNSSHRGSVSVELAEAG